mgnify:CR=1 FL=1
MEDQPQLKNDILNQHLEHFIVGISTSLLFRGLGLIENDKVLPYTVALTTGDYIRKHWREGLYYLPAEYLK